MKILVVDDSVVMRRIHLNLLRDMGFTDDSLLDASDGEAALKLSLEEHIDLFLLDWNMPKINGLSFTKQLREIEQYKEVPVIMVTSESARYNVIEAIKAGVTNYVVKPIKSEVLQEKIEKYLRPEGG